MPKRKAVSVGLKGPARKQKKRKTCENAECSTRPTFGILGGTARFCAKHKEVNMVNVVDSTCENAECSKQPTFGLFGGNARFCADHKELGMVNVVSPTCENAECSTRPSFGILDGTARFCAEHKEDGMVNVVSPTCENAECSTRVRYGFPGFKASMCAQHKTEGMIVYPTKRCIIAGCKSMAIFGTTTKQLHCEEHATAGEINLIERRCSKCNLLNIVNPVNDMCGCCDLAFRQSKPVKAKELTIKAFLEYNSIKFVYDRTLKDSCGNVERPDFLIDQGTFYIIVEVDEHQHKTYQCSQTCECPDAHYRHCKCQQGRMLELTQLAQKPCVWLRYNPDTFKINDKTAKITPKKRQDELLRYIKHYQGLTELPEWFVVKYLYYDE